MGKQKKKKLTIKVGAENWKVPFVTEFDILGHRPSRNGTGTRWIERSLNRGQGCWWRDSHIYRAKDISQGKKCNKILRITFTPKNEEKRRTGGLQKKEPRER